MARVALISGGSKGLGRALVEAFLADRAYQVATFSRSPTAFVRGLLDDPKLDGRFLYAPVDIADREAVRAFVRSVLDRFHAIDVLINNAGIALDGLLALQADSDVDRMIDTNLKGTLALTKACARAMLLKRAGSIVNVSSIVGRSGYRGLSTYSLTKAGLDGLTRSLARELGACGITVNSVAPGFLETELSQGLSPAQRQRIVQRTPMGRLGRTTDVIGIVKLLASRRGAYITGQTIVVDGGITA